MMEEKPVEQLIAERRLSIEQAKSGAAKTLREMNEEFAVVEDGGKMWVVHWIDDPILGRPALARLRFSDFRQKFLNRSVTFAGLNKDGLSEAVQTQNLAEWWLRNPARNSYQ